MSSTYGGPIVRIVNLQKSFGDLEVLCGVDMEVEKGEVVVILGPSGSGKSTLMHIVGALDIPTSGKYLFKGKDISKEIQEAKNDYKSSIENVVFKLCHL